MLKNVIIALIAFLLIGCQTAPTSTKTINANGKPVVVNQYQTQKTMIANAMSRNVNQCIALATAKFNADQAKLNKRDIYVPNGILNADQMIALQLAKALENTFMATIQANKEITLARLGTPFSSSGLPACEKLGYSHMVIEKKKINHDTLNNLGGKVLKAGLAVFGIYQGTKVALKVVDELAEPEIQSGDGSTNILGDGNTYEPDNRVNSCIEDGTCVTPVEEEDEIDEDQLEEILSE